MTETAEVIWTGPEALRPLLVPIDSVHQHPKNARRGNVAETAKSVSRFGQTKPVVLDPDRAIAAGNHTWQAIKGLGWTHIAAVEDAVSRDESLAFNIADNRTSDLATYEEQLLANALAELRDAGRLEGTGWTPDDVDDLEADLGRMAEAERRAFDGGRSETDEEIAERQALRQGGAVMREVVLMLDEDQYAKFGVYVRILRKELGTEGVINTVFRTVELAAQRANVEGAEAV